MLCFGTYIWYHRFPYSKYIHKVSRKNRIWTSLIVFIYFRTGQLPFSLKITIDCSDRRQPYELYDFIAAVFANHRLNVCYQTVSNIILFMKCHVPALNPVFHIVLILHRIFWLKCASNINQIK